MRYLRTGRLGQEWPSRVKYALSQEDFIRRVSLAVGAALICCVLNLAAVCYANWAASNWVTDIWLSNVPVLNVAGLFIYGTGFGVVFALLVFLTYPARVPFALYSLSLFWLIRSAFVCLTHIAIYPDHSHFDLGVTITKAFFGDDMFFSAHTGVPLLGALVYWRQPILRAAFMMWTIFFASIVLLGHLHYSIDVAAAFFITVSIYGLAKKLFRDDGLC